MFRILFLGDVVGRLGRRIVSDKLPGLRQQFSADLVIVNGENSAGGMAIDPKSATEIFSAGADVITTGNHVWHKKEIFKALDDTEQAIIRPHNYPSANPGRGFYIWTSPSGIRVGVANLIARVFMPDLADCPFSTADHLLETVLADCQIRFVDFHGEATSEKLAFGFHLDGRVSAIVGTHTHVQTADERVLPNGTAFICDAGMCGPADSVIGVQKEMVIERFRTGRPVRFDVAKGAAIINGVVIDVDESSGKATHIERINSRFEA